MNNFTEREIQSLSFLVPSKVYKVKFDIVKKNPIPALIENSIKIISTVGEITEQELKEYFGLNSIESEILVNQILLTGWVKFNMHGNLEATQKLLEWKSENLDGVLEISETLLFDETVTIDLLTKHIQPRSETDVIRGLPEIKEFDLNGNYDINEIFNYQFNRFKECTNNQNIKHPKSLLYKIRETRSEKVSKIICVLKFVLKRDGTGEYILDTDLVSHSDKHKKLINSSGLHSNILDYLSNVPKKSSNNLSFQHYCDIVQDSVLSIFYNYESNYFDLISYLLQRKTNKTGYGNQNTTALIGPMWLTKNQDKIKNILKYNTLNSKIDKVPLLIWKPSNTDFFAASAVLKIFINQLNQDLKEVNSELVTLFPIESNNTNRSEIYRLKEKFKYLIGNAYFVENNKLLDESEIFILPGENGMAYCQYHVQINPELGYPGLTIPIGYITTDQIKIEKLWNYIKAFYKINDIKKISVLNKIHDSNVNELRINNQLEL